MTTNAEIPVVRRWRTRKGFIAAGVATAMAILLLASLGMEAPLNSPADAVRPHAYDYNRIFMPQKAIGRPIPSPPAEFTLTTNGQNITLGYDASPRPFVDLLEPAQIHQADTPNAQLGDGLGVELTRIGFVGRTQSNMSWTLPGNRLSATFFTPEYKTIDPGRLYLDLPKASERALTSGGNFPSVSFDFKIAGPAHRVIGGLLLDARTHSFLGHLTPETLATGEQRLSGQPLMWHGAPVLLVLDLAVGPLAHEFVEPAPGAVFKMGEVSGQILFVGTNVSATITKFGSGKLMNKLEFSIKPAPNDSVIYYRFANNIHRHGYEPVYLNAANEPQPIRLDMPFSELRVIGVNRGIEKGDRLEFARYTRHKQVVFRLSEIPGLPPENGNTKNLFSVRTPYLRFNDAAEQMAFILGTTQLNGVHSHPTPNRGAYPREFTNATVAEVMLDYSSLTPSVIGYKVDQTYFTLKENAPGLRKTLDIIRQKLGWP